MPPPRAICCLVVGALGCSFPDYEFEHRAPASTGTVCTDGAASDTETGLDCGGICPPCLAGEGCVEGNDCESGVCESGVCQRPSCEDVRRNGDETDTDCGGTCLLRCAIDRGCLSGHDCQSGVCTAGICQAASCDDLTRNGAETGIDCGGPCPACENGKPCAVNQDCSSTRCVSAICVSAGCSDGSKNGDETGVDCGGSCPACVSGDACLAAADCSSSICDATTQTCRAASCTDGVPNAAETDVDCGGACPGCTTGLHCLEGTDCASGLCNSGVCMPDTPSGTQLSRANWQASASNSDVNSPPLEAIDDDLGSRWSSGTNQVPGIWFELDVAEPQIFFSFVLDNTGAGTGDADEPISFDVHLSLDGNLGVPVKVGLVGAPVTTVTFESAQYARYIHLVLKSTHQNPYEKWWSIHDLRVAR